MASVSKTEFAALAGISQGRVTQLISEGKIRAASLEGEGRKARIIVDLALKDLNRSLDVSQRVGLNGLKGTMARSDAAEAQAETPALDDGRMLARGADVADLIAKEKLRQAEFQTRRQEREEALELGRYMLAEDARSAMAQTAAKVIAAIEGGLHQMADTLAADLGVNRDAAVHALMKGFRVVRQKAADGFADEAEMIRTNKGGSADPDGGGRIPDESAALPGTGAG